MASWGLGDLPDLSGKTALITGGNIGLGFKSSLELARASAHVIIACRSQEKGADAIGRICSEVPSASLSHVALDLTSGTSIHACAEAVKQSHDRLDILMNNAGVVNLETLQHTETGHEMQMATNHFGHFALTGHLFSLLTGTLNARVVTLSSLAYRSGEIRFDDLDWRKRKYDRLKAYGDSKLANLIFMNLLHQRFEKAGASAISVAAHPGLTGTERQQSTGIGGGLSKRIASKVEVGVLPQLKAALHPDIAGGDFIGPRFGLRGRPTKLSPKLNRLEADVPEKLWALSAEVTGVTFPA